MPDVNASTIATALPGGTRRRTWANPEVLSHSLVVLTFDRLYTTPLAGAPRPEVLAAADAGHDLDELLGPLAVVVDLFSVRQVKLDLLTNSLSIEYAKGRHGHRAADAGVREPGSGRRVLHEDLAAARRRLHAQTSLTRRLGRGSRSPGVALLCLTCHGRAGAS